MGRCMGTKLMNDDYPDQKQRYAVCQSQWDDKNKKGSADMKEVRSFIFVRSDVKEDRKMVGHAAVFGEPADIGGWFREQIEPGAFTASIKKDDIRALWNHNPDYVLGRNTAGTLTLAEDDKGLKTEINPPDTQWARDLAVSIERGDINQMSFAFEVLAVEWIRGEDKELDLRKIKKVRLFDVSPVTFPAYEGTDIALRSHDAWAKTQEGQDPPGDPAAEAAGRLSLRRQLLIGRF